MNGHFFDEEIIISTVFFTKDEKKTIWKLFGKIVADYY